MSIASDTFVKQSERIAARVVEGNAVVIVIDAQTLHTLNEVGTFVWSAIGPEGKRLDVIVSELTREFDVERAEAEADVQTFVAELVELGALELDASPSGETGRS